MTLPCSGTTSKFAPFARLALANAGSDGPLLRAAGKAPGNAEICNEDRVLGCRKVKLNRGYFKTVRKATEDLEVEVIEGILMNRTEVRGKTVFFEVVFNLKDLLEREIQLVFSLSLSGE